MLILIYGIPESVPSNEQKDLRDKIQNRVAEILNIQELIKPIFVEIIPSRFSDSAGLFAQIYLDEKEKEAQSKSGQIKATVCATIKDFATRKIQPCWMVGVFCSVEDFLFSEIEF